VGTLIVLGGNRDWQQNLRRDQLLGSFSYFKDSRFGNHLLRAGGEIFRTTAAEIWRRSYPGDVLHVLRNGGPIEVYLFQAPSRSESGLWTYAAYASDSWRVNRRLTLNVGLRFDRNRVFLSEQTHPIGRFNSEPQTFAAVANVIDWNMMVPRISVIHDLTGNGKSVVKFSYGHYSFPPGTDVGFNANPNASTWWRRYTWSDVNASGVWEPAEEGRLLDSRGGTALESIDPRLKLPLLKEMGAWFERELPGSIGLRTGIVWRGEQQHFLRQNAGRPFGAFSVPIAIRDPGPDGRFATDDDRPALDGYQFGPELRDQPSNIVRNVPHSDSHYWTWDLTASRRFSHHWSLVAGVDHVWNRDQANVYFGQAVRQNAYPLTPNDLLNAGPDGRYEFRTWSARLYGTYEGPWDVRVTPSLRHQSGQPFGRTFTTSLNYGNVRILAEPIGTRRMDNITIVDIRVEKGVRLSGSWRIAAFVDVFNLLNANPEQNMSWSSGTFLRPLSIVAPRIARVGMKMDW
jgi:TonB dependent receptor